MLDGENRRNFEKMLENQVEGKQLMSKVKVTIGLCVKNSEKTLSRCLESILNQNYPKDLLEIIVVDGESKDKTVEIAAKLILSSGISSKLYSDKGKGLGTARQIVLDNADGKYIVWVDSDVAICENFIKSQVEFMENNPQMGIAFGRYIHNKNFNTSLPATLESLSKYVSSSEFQRIRKSRGLPPNDASIFRVDAARQVTGFDKNIKGASEDEDIIIRMKEKGWLFFVNEKAEFYAHLRENWHDLLLERMWFGYGKHYLGHKHKGLHVCMYSIPLVHFYIGIKVGLKAYKLTLSKKSFLIPLAYVFMTIAWWFGFIKAHIKGYGHKKWQVQLC
jgi:glycosyltransferase involved in cell wall biosynthesis